ncbi:MAG: heme-binding protein [Chthoniobacteraceae bacterium]
MNAAALASLLFATTALAQPQLTEVTRKPDAYNTWKLALTPGIATDAATISSPPGFKVELIRSAAPDEDSWISMAFDPKGRLTIAREKKGLLRMTVSPGAGVERVEVIDDTLLECRGLLYAHDALYVNANNSKVLVRLRDTDGDDRFDETTELLRTGGGVGHGRNHVKLGPDGMLYLVHGNNVVAPPNSATDSPLRNFQDDRIIPCPWDPQMFDGDVKLPAGHILRGDRDGKSWTLVAGGFRNPLDVAFNDDGEMFTFDADMEWDTGTPWYRPCRVNHVLSGADYGWRRGTSKWPEYFPDCGPTTVNIGLGSPTGIEFGTRSNFPTEWKRALFICDWSYGRIVAVRLQPRGASYTGTAENFVVGKPLNVTDLAFGTDGAMYFITGGRRTQSGLYRVSYTRPAEKHRALDAEGSDREARALRRQLEALHGHAAPGAVEKIWQHLGSTDAAIRHAARVALEWQDVRGWQGRALAEPDTHTALTALMALARSGADDVREALIAKLNALDFASLDEDQQLIALRDYQLALVRLGTPPDTSALAQRLDALYPAKSWRVTHLLCELLAHLKVPNFRDKTVALLTQSTRSEDLLHYLFFLRLVPDGWTLDQRRAFFAALNHAETLEGARDYQRSMKMIRAEVLERLTPAEHEAVAPLLAAAAQVPAPISSGPQVLVRDWKLEDLAPALDRVGRGRSFDAGKQAFAGAQCVLCHRIGLTGSLVGPDLTAVSSRFNRRDLLDSILNPSRVIDDKFRSVAFTLKSGATVVGTIEHENENAIVVRLSPLAPEVTKLDKADVRSREPSPISPMPGGLLNVLTQNQILDLLAYIESGGEPKHRDFAP